MTQDDDPHHGPPRQALESAAEWSGIAVAVLPVLHVADRAGLGARLTAPQSLELGALVVPLAQIAFFIGLGIAVSALVRRHSPRHRLWLFLGCALPTGLFIVNTGLRLVTLIALVAWSFAAVQLGLARDTPPWRPTP